jgi:WD40 repeat protein
MRFEAVLALVLLLVPCVVLAREPRADPDGDLLPEGALARFGSGRRLHGGAHRFEFSPDGKLLASSGSGGARVWELCTGKEVFFAHLPRIGPILLAFTPDGAHLVADGKGCRVIEPSSGKVRCFWRNAGKLPENVLVAADGKSAATVWAKGGISVHDLTGKGKRMGRQITDDESRELALSEDGSLLAFGRQGVIELWDVRRGRLLHTYAPEEQKESTADRLCFSRDGRRLAAYWGRLRLWDTRSHAEVEGFAGAKVWYLEFLRFSADGDELVGLSGHYGRRLWRWSAATGKELAHSESPKEKDMLWYPVLSPDGRTVAGGAGSYDYGAVRLWDAGSWNELHPVERWPSWDDAAFVEPGVVAVHAHGEGTDVLAFWEAASGKLLRRRAVAVGKDDYLNRALSPDGALLAAGDGPVRLFDVASGKELRQFDPSPKESDLFFAFSTDGKTLVSGDKSDKLQLWDVETGKALHRLHGASRGAAAFSPDGRIVASGDRDYFFLTEVASGQVRYRLDLPDRSANNRPEYVPRVRRICFTRYGRSVLAVTSSDLFVYSTARGDVLSHLHLGDISDGDEQAAAISPDGRWLARAYHRTVRVHDLRKPLALDEAQPLFGHESDVRGIAFSPEGKYLVTCGRDGTALVWDAKQLTGKSKPSEPAEDADAIDIEGKEPAPRTPEKKAEAYWKELGGADAGTAARAMAALEEIPEAAAAVLKARLKPVEAPPTKRIERLIADLDRDTFEVRQQAHQELSRLGEQAAPALRMALEGKPSAEAAKQAKELLNDLEGPATDPELLRRLRAVEVLERIGTAPARKVLEELAKGAPNARLTREAKASLERWAKP